MKMVFKGCYGNLEERVTEIVDKWKEIMLVDPKIDLEIVLATVTKEAGNNYSINVEYYLYDPRLFDLSAKLLRSDVIYFEVEE